MPAGPITDQFRLYLVTDDHGRSIDELASIVSRAVDGGVTAVQFREKCAAPAFCIAAFSELSKICTAADVSLILNSDVFTHFKNGPLPDGIHFNERTLPLHAHKIASIAGYSAHNLEEAVQAFEHGVDFCTLSPIYDTPSKEGILPAIGLEALRSARRVLPNAPLLALGGVNEDNAVECIRAGATGLAVMRAIMDAPNPADAAARLRAKIQSAQ